MACRVRVSSHFVYCVVRVRVSEKRRGAARGWTVVLKNEKMSKKCTTGDKNAMAMGCALLHYPISTARCLGGRSDMLLPSARFPCLESPTLMMEEAESSGISLQVLSTY